MMHIFTISASEEEEFEAWKKEHDAKIRADAIEEFANVLGAEPFSAYVMAVVRHWADKLKEQNK